MNSAIATCRGAFVVMAIVMLSIGGCNTPAWLKNKRIPFVHGQATETTHAPYSNPNTGYLAAGSPFAAALAAHDVPESSTERSIRLTDENHQLKKMLAERNETIEMLSSQLRAREFSLQKAEKELISTTHDLTAFRTQLNKWNEDLRLFYDRVRQVESRNDQTWKTLSERLAQVIKENSLPPKSELNRASEEVLKPQTNLPQN